MQRSRSTKQDFPTATIRRSSNTSLFRNVRRASGCRGRRRNNRPGPQIPDRGRHGWAVRALAVIASPPPSSDEVKRFLSRPGDGPRLGSTQGRGGGPHPKGWHVFFFRPPTFLRRAEADFRRGRALFSEATLRVLHDDSGPVEFEAPKPVTDHAWATTNVGAFMRFARLHVPIVSFQGSRFSGFESGGAPSTPVR